MSSPSRFRRSLRPPIVLVSALFVLSACSSNGGSSSAPASTAPAGSGQASASASATQAPAAKLKMGVAPAIFSYLPTYVAKEKGFWDEQNIDVEVAVLGSGTDLTQALTGDAIDFAAASYNEPIVMSAQGVPTVIIAMIEAALPYRYMTRPDITDIKQLVGKTVGVSRVGSLSDQVTRIVFNKAGIDPDSVKYQAAGGSPDRLAALTNGAIAGTLLDSPSYQLAQKAGMTTLVNVAQERKGFPYEMLITKKASVEADKDLYTRLLVGYIKGAQYATDPANEDEVLEIVSKYTGQKVEDLKVAYAETIKDFPPDGKIELEGIADALKGAQDFADIKCSENLKAEDIVDTGPQEAAAKLLGLP
jgi:NitT/TauT family transport system substrate-binding protein